MTQQALTIPPKARPKRWLWGLAVVVLGLGALLWWQFLMPKLATVTVEVVAEGPATRVLAVNGQVAAQTAIAIRAAVSGTLQGTMASEGDVAAAGAVLAQLDASQQLVEVRNAQSALHQGVLQQAQASADHTRLRNLGAITPRTTLEAARLTLDRATQSVDALQGALEQARIQQNRYTITAPIAGTITQRNVDPGQFIDPAVTVFTLSDLSHLVIVTDVDEAYATQITLGQPAVLQLVGTAATLPGKVSFVSPRVDPATGGMQVKITPDMGLKAPVGLTVTANIVVDDRASALTVPRTAMVEGPAVFVLVGGRIVITPITVVDWPAARLVVTSGLVAGDRVVLDPAGLTDGQAVAEAQ